MASPTPPVSSELDQVKSQVPPPDGAKTNGLFGQTALEEWTEKKIDDIEMIGEEMAAGFRSPGHSEVSPGMRYLHSSRTIHQLVTDRNRAVGLYLGVATLLWTASTALLNARPTAALRIPIEILQVWCLPITFATMTVLAVFVGLLLVRTRVGLIYEVAKMNLLLGLPPGRVKRINPLSIFFLMHALVSLAGGVSAALFTMYMMSDPGTSADPATVPKLVPILIGVAITALLILLYVGMVLQTTSEGKLPGNADKETGRQGDKETNP
jgi:hypothetical protein